MTSGKVYEIVDLVADEAIVPCFCSKTVDNAKRQFAIFLSQNKFNSHDFQLNEIGSYSSSASNSVTVCRGSDVLLSDYMREPVVNEVE